MSVATQESTMQMTDEQKRQFKEEGYFLLERAVPQAHLELLRDEAQYAIERVERAMDEQNTDALGPNYRNRRYFSANVFKDRPVLRQFLFSELMADICRATIGPEAFLFYEQYVIKCADKGMKFSWHQDSGYVGFDHTPYLTCWIPLDDVNEENGTVYLLPFSQTGIRTMVKHVRDPNNNNDMVGYFGSHRGIPIIAPAGSIACFSSLLFHCSGSNLTSKMRRVYLAQYSPDMIRNPSGELQGNAEPFLSGGRNIARLAK
jgi:ectoine hydroxylase-related dioxygenase (phytanoyl-CoA dioxygenase family)